MIRLAKNKLGEPLGRITFELFKDVVPKTAENFRQFCTGESKNSVGRPQGYKGSKFHRIVSRLRPSSGFPPPLRVSSCHLCVTCDEKLDSGSEWGAG